RALICIWLAASARAQVLDFVETPTSFFTNIAERLLQSQLNLSLTRIPVSPVNEYSPAVHRLLQVAANLYDASTNGFDPLTGISFPSVFRPLFRSEGSNVFICGYTNDNDARTAPSWFANSPDGIPMVIGPKKGVPI